MKYSESSVIYFFLNEVDWHACEKIRNVKCVTLTFGTKASPNMIEWNHGDKKLNMGSLIEEARHIVWSTTVKEVFARYGVDSLSSNGQKIQLEDIQDKLPGQIAALNVKEFEASDIFQTLIVESAKILQTRIAFVFPQEWPTQREMLKEVIDRLAINVHESFRDLSPEMSFDLVFLSRNERSAGERDSDCPFSSFISQLHSHMLEQAKTDYSVWSKKNGTILLSGPTGSGKSYAARQVASQFNNKLVEINLSSVNETLLESRMRGYERGTFTGQEAKGKSGWFEDANGGVLFLDEFQSAPIAFQAQLLDLLSAVSNNVQIAKVGKDESRKNFKVKVILAINEEISKLVEQNRLRKDVLYRVRHIESFPSLNERLNQDAGYKYLKGLLWSYRWKCLPPLSRDKLTNIKLDDIRSYFPTFTNDALFELKSHNWEGNFRELERVAFDIFDVIDGRFTSEVDSEVVKKVIHAWLSKTKAIDSDKTPSGPNEAEQRKIQDIQNALRRSNFVIKTTLNGEYQSYFKSRPPLRRYLNKYRSYLDEDVINDSRIIEFLSRDVEL